MLLVIHSLDTCFWHSSPHIIKGCVESYRNDHFCTIAPSVAINQLAEQIFSCSKIFKVRSNPISFPMWFNQCKWFQSTWVHGQLFLFRIYLRIWSLCIPCNLFSKFHLLLRVRKPGASIMFKKHFWSRKLTTQLCNSCLKSRWVCLFIFICNDWY